MHINYTWWSWTRDPECLKPVAWFVCLGVVFFFTVRFSESVCDYLFWVRIACNLENKMLEHICIVWYHTFSAWLQLASNVNCISKQTVPRHWRTHYPWNPKRFRTLAFFKCFHWAGYSGSSRFQGISGWIGYWIDDIAVGYVKRF